MGPEQKTEGSLVSGSFVEMKALGHMPTPVGSGPESNRLCRSLSQPLHSAVVAGKLP